MTLTRSRALIALAAITALGACFRFYGLLGGAPYYHFHIDEHFVFTGADLLRGGMEKAALSPKFFMYGPLPMYFVNIARAVYEAVGHPLDLNVPADQITYTALGRSISAVFGTATIPLVYLVSTRLGGRLAGLISATLLACAVIHLRDSHFFTVDITLIFFCVVAWAAAMAIAERGSAGASVAAGVAFGAAVACKYTAVFLAPVIVVAHLCSPSAPRTLRPWNAWLSWSVRAVLPLAIGVVVFFALDPMVLRFNDKFRADVAEQITGPLLGGLQPIWNAHFRDVQPQLYWFTNLLPWGIGPAFAAWGIAGVIYLVTRRTRLAIAAAAYPLAHFAIAGQTVTPFMRYALPLIPGLAVGAGVLSAGLIASPRWRRAGMAATAIVLLVTGGWAAAYMNVYAMPDPRLEASRFLYDTVPAGTRVVVEPSQNTPPLGVYYTAPSFYRDHIGWDPNSKRDDHFVLLTLDVYRFLYNPRLRDEAKQRYIDQRVSGAEYVVMDDTFVEFYEHLPDPEHRVVHQYYRDLFDGRLGFQLIRRFHRGPRLFGWRIHDEAAELSFTLFDHPDVFVFKRVGTAATLGPAARK